MLRLGGLSIKKPSHRLGGVKVVDRESHRRRRLVKEAVCIRKTEAAIYRDGGNYELPQVYDDIIQSH